MRYEIRAMSWSEIMDTAFRILRNHFVLLVGIAATVYLPLSILGGVTTRAVERGPSNYSLAELVLGGLGLVLLVSVGATIVFAAITHAIAELYCGREVTWQGALARAQRSFMPLVGTTLLSGLVVFLGFVLLIVPSIYLFLSFVVLWPVMLIEGTFGTRALRRSHALMQGHLLRALGLLSAVWVVSTVLTTALTLPVTALPILGAVVPGAVNSITNAYGAAIAVVLYFDVRCRKEAFDLEHLAALVAPPPGEHVVA